MAKHTILLSKILGVYLTAVAVIVLSARQPMIHLFDETLANPPALRTTAIIGLACGLAIVYLHNLWRGGLAPVLVTLIGWIAIAKCILLLVLSPPMEVAFLVGVGYPKFLSLYVLVDLAMGLYLGYVGFFGGTHPAKSARVAA